MKLCPYCRLMSGELRVGQVRGSRESRVPFGRLSRVPRPGRAYVSWACEGCQKGVDQALAWLAIVWGIQRGQLHPGILARGVR